MGCINLAGTLAAVALMDRAGRRILILLSHAGMAACLILIAIVTFIPGMQPVGDVQQQQLTGCCGLQSFSFVALLYGWLILRLNLLY